MTPRDRHQIEQRLLQPANKRIRDSFREEFGDTIPEDEEFFGWWDRFLASSLGRNGLVRDGWLTGIDYGDD